jgi:uncharacterized alpha-E superfamily protein
MLSRLADSFYWMSRYIERAENVSRFIDVNVNLMLDSSLSEDKEQWFPLVTTSGDEEDFKSRYEEATRENVIHFLFADKKNPNSIFSCLQKARENARTMRESISSEMWEQLNSFYLIVQSYMHEPLDLDNLYSLGRQIRMASHQFVGVTDNTMSHGEAWNFIRLGRMFERADKTARILDVKYFILLPKVEDVGTTYDAILWTALLKSASASEMYRKKYSHIQPDKVAEFLILDREFPRSVRFCLAHAEESLRFITGTPYGTYANEAEQQLGRLRYELDYANIREIIKSGLHEYLDQFESNLNNAGVALFATFLAMQPIPGYPIVKRTEQK